MMIRSTQKNWILASLSIALFSAATPAWSHPGNPDPIPKRFADLKNDPGFKDACPITQKAIQQTSAQAAQLGIGNILKDAHQRCVEVKQNLTSKSKDYDTVSNLSQLTAKLDLTAMSANAQSALMLNNGQAAADGGCKLEQQDTVLESMSNDYNSSANNVPYTNRTGGLQKTNGTHQSLVNLNFSITKIKALKAYNNTAALQQSAQELISLHDKVKLLQEAINSREDYNVLVIDQLKKMNIASVKRAANLASLTPSTVTGKEHKVNLNAGYYETMSTHQFDTEDTPTGSLPPVNRRPPGGFVFVAQGAAPEPEVPASATPPGLVDKAGPSGDQAVVKPGDQASGGQPGQNPGGPTVGQASPGGADASPGHKNDTGSSSSGLKGGTGPGSLGGGPAISSDDLMKDLMIGTMGVGLLASAANLAESGKKSAASSAGSAAGSTAAPLAPAMANPSSTNANNSPGSGASSTSNLPLSASSTTVAAAGSGVSGVADLAKEIRGSSGISSGASSYSPGLAQSMGGGGAAGGLSASSDSGAGSSRSSESGEPLAKKDGKIAAKSGAPDLGIGFAGGGGGASGPSGGAENADADTSVKDIMSNVQNMFNPAAPAAGALNAGAATPASARSLASSSNSASQHEIAAQDSSPLFDRVHDTIRRCVNKGDVINGLRAKL